MRLIPQSLIWIITPEDLQEHDMTGFAQRFWLGDSGMGMPPVRRITERGPQQHGDTDLGFRLEAREMTLVFGFPTAGGLEYWEKRRDILDIFKPSDDPLLLTVQSFDDETFKRSIYFHYISDLELSSDQASDIDEGGTWDLVTVKLRAADPIWFDPSAYALQLAGIAISGFNVPTEVPSYIGGVILSASVDLAYAGSWLEYPIIQITGPFDSIVISNDTTGEILDFGSYSLAAGATITIDLRYGFKTVTLQDGTNLIGELTGESDLAAWHLQHGRSGSNINTITVTGTAATVDTRVDMLFYNRYIGI